jgi:hypothetical protein
MITTAPIPELFRWRWFSGEGKVRVLNLYQIRNLARGNRSPQEVRERADHLVDEIVGCFDPLLFSATRSLWEHEARPVYSRFPEGFEKHFESARVRGPDALESETLVPALRVIDESTNDFRESDRLVKALPTNIAKADVIEAVYTKRGREIYFWYKQYPAGFEELKSRLPADHPLLRVRPPVNAAPVRYPD